MKSSHFAAVAVAVGLSIAPARGAFADDVADEADLQFELATKKYTSGDYVGALEHFLASNRLAPNANVVFDIARCYEHLERFPDAYRFYAAASETPVSPERTKEIAEAIARIRAKVAILEVETDPPGATIYLNRKDLGARGDSPRSLGLAAGTYTVIAELADHEPAQSTPIDVTLGTTTKVKLTLVPVFATVHVAGNDAKGVEVRIDDATAQLACVAPCDVKLSPGPHTIFFARAGFESSQTHVVVAPKESLSLSPSLAVRKGSVVVEADVRSAVVEIDGKVVGFAPAVLSVPIGPHALKISAEGYRPYAQAIIVSESTSTKVSAELTESLEVRAASRALERVEDAPASISVITKDELVGMGYPTIAEALRGVRGVFVDDDRGYASVGIRGFNPPGDYGSNVLVLVDGHPTNENYSGGAAVGFDARTDLDDVERIEIVRGPGSALYGTSAFYGVINLVTRSRDQPTHLEAGVSAVEYGVLRGRVHATYKASDDAGFWVSLSGARDPNGRDFTFAEYAVGGANGQSIGNDGFDAGTLTGRAWWKDLTVQWLYTYRLKHVPTGVSETTFPSNLTDYEDRHGLVEARYEPKIGDVQTLTRVHANLYFYDETLDYPLAVDPTTNRYTGGAYHDSYRGDWFGAEERLVFPLASTLRVTLGGEGQYHARTWQGSTTQVGEKLLDRNDPFTVGAGYLVADWTPHESVKISPAIRVDYYSTTGTSLNPRLAVVLHESADTTTKLLAGKAFRAPSVFELFYQSATWRTPDGLKPEDIYSGEIEVSQRFSKTVTATLSGYANYVKNLVELTGAGTESDPNYYANSDRPVLSTGVEGEVRRDFRQGWMLAAQVSLQRTRYVGTGELRREVPNSPNVLASLKAGVPIIVPRTLLLMTRFSFVGPRWDRYDRADDPPQSKIEGALIWDLVFSGESARGGVHYGIGVYNVLDTRWYVPVSGEYRMTSIVQNGRTLYASLGITL